MTWRINTDIPEPDWDSLPDHPEPYKPSEPRRPNPVPLPKEYAAINAALACGHVGRLPDTTPDDLTARIEAERDGLIKAIRLPWWNLNKHIGFGLYPGNITIVAGPPGTSKSYFALNTLLAAGKAGYRWRLLPLEDNAETWALKALATNLDSWELISQPENEDDRRALGERKLAQLNKHRDFISDMFQCIAENPRMPVKGMDGSRKVFDVNYQDVLRFVEDEAEASDIVCIDPISQITFDADGRDFRGQSDFMRRLAAIAADTKIHVLLIAHDVKQHHGGTEGVVQGSAMFERLAHSVLILSRHDPSIEDSIYSTFNPTIAHRLTITVKKCRAGSSGKRFAFDLSDFGPTFKEHGMIKSEPLKRKAGQ